MNRLDPSRMMTALPILTLVVAGVAAFPASAGEVDLPRHPSLSPDGGTLVFTWRGDLWRAASSGGEAVRLTSSAGSESRSAFSPDGTRIVFESERDGPRNLWSMAADGSDLRQLTELDAPLALSSVGMLGGKPMVFLDSTLEGDLYRSTRPYVLPLEGGVPTRLHDAFGSAASASPDGSQVLFERGGGSWSRRGYNGPDDRDVWAFDPATRTFRALTAYDGNDGFPRFIGNGEYLYVSDRGTGTLNVHRAPLDGPPDSGRRLTDFDGADVHGLAVSRDGRTAVLAVLGDLYRIDLTSATPRAEKLRFTAADDAAPEVAYRSVGREVSEAALSPDGKTIAVVADGDVFVRATDDRAPTRRVTEGEARERDLCWSADGLTLYFASDRDGSDSLYAATVAETRTEARERGKPKKPAAVAEPVSEAKPASKTETQPEAKPEARPESSPEAAPATPSGAKPESKPESKQESKPTKPETKPETKKDPALDPARWADAVRFEIRAMTSGPDNDRRPVASPDGTCLLFTRNLGDLARLDLATGESKVIHPGWDDELEYVFSPDGSLVALAEHDQDFNKDVWILAADGSRPAVNVTRHPDNDGSPRFSADNRILAFLSERTNEETDVWMVMLDRDLEGYSARDLEQYFKDAGDAAKKRKPLEAKVAPKAAPKAEAEPAGEAKKEAETEAEKEAEREATPESTPESTPEATPASKPARDPFEGLELDDAYLRVKRVTTLPGSEDSLELVPAGDRVVFSATEGKERALFSAKYDGTDQKRLAGAVRVSGLSLAGDRVVGVLSGSAQTIGLTGDVKPLEISATSRVDLAARNVQKFDEVSRLMQWRFYKDPKEKGLDWPALTARYRELAARARTSEEFDFVANAFIGHLDASHLGVRSPEGGAARSAAGDAGGSRRTQGRLGVATTAAEGARAVVSVLANSPAALANPRLEPGDLIHAIDFEPVDPAKPLEPMLAGKTGQEVFVSFRRPKQGDAGWDELQSILVPIGASEERALRYQSEVLANARKVERLSGGRIGYLHVQSMDQASLDRFERDLYAAAAGREALLVDVRNNGGGSTADRLLASIDVRPHAVAVPREGDRSRASYPQDRLFIQRYTLPMGMLCNEKSFSNAEIMSHAFRTLGRGPLVGQQTAGGVISTGSESLVDGTTVRMPFRGWYLPDGRDMEENGAMPDVVVVQTPEDESAGRDRQLERAVEVMLSRLPKR